MTHDRLAPSTVGVRRSAAPDLGSVGQSDELVARIREEIRAAGPMPFARFMDLALYDSQGGYYRADEARPGRGGDFLTAPELHPIFGACLATGLQDVWARLGRPEPFVIREHGAGTGALAIAILDAIDDDGFRAAVRYEPVEVDERRVVVFRAALTAAGHAAAMRDPDSAPFDGVVLANEVLDALPVHRVRQRGAGLRELAVAIGSEDALVEVEIEPCTPALAERLASEGITLREGQTAEICLGLEDWIARAAAPLRRGLVLLIDYGAAADELYDPRRRPDGTLRAYLRHTVHDDPYRHVGRQDLTAHVDWTAVERAAEAAGLTLVGRTTQAELLMGLGIEGRLRAIQADPSTTLESYTLLRASILRLLDPAAMGRFGVLGLGRAWPGERDDPPRLFAYRLPTRASSPAPPRTPPD
jgi:SAM-dependent MidA family methyltransferase